MANYSDESTYSTASGIDGLKYVVLQVTLKEKFLRGRIRKLIGFGIRFKRTGCQRLSPTHDHDCVCHQQRFLGGDRIQATMVFEKIL